MSNPNLLFFGLKLFLLKSHFFKVSIGEQGMINKKNEHSENIKLRRYFHILWIAKETFLFSLQESLEFSLRTIKWNVNNQSSSF